MSKLSFKQKVLSALESNEHLVYLLLPPGKVPQIGPERMKSVRGNLAKLVSDHGSVRYVYFQEGKIVAALQVMDLTKQGGKGGHVANVYVDKDFRKRKLGTKLFEQAKKDFGTVSISDDLSDVGRSWKEAMEKL